jgi:RNA polymerase sigma-70 factor, ECF subfamily
MSTSWRTIPFREDLSAARAGDPDAQGRLLQSFRTYLLIIANREIDDHIRAKGGASDVVQDSLYEAHRAFDSFRGRTEDELRAWLRRVLLNNLRDLGRRHAGTLKRDIGVERSLDHGPKETLVDRQLTPGATLVARENAVRLENTLQRLPTDYREVIDLRFRRDLPFAEIGRLMARSEDAARMLLFRAVERLQEMLGGQDDAGGRHRTDPRGTVRGV